MLIFKGPSKSISGKTRLIFPDIFNKMLLSVFDLLWYSYNPYFIFITSLGRYGDPWIYSLESLELMAVQILVSQQNRTAVQNDSIGQQVLSV